MAGTPARRWLARVQYGPSWAIDGANRNDIRLLEPTLDDVASNGLLADIDTLHLGRGYDYPIVRAHLAAIGLDDLAIQRRNKHGVGDCGE